MLYYLINSVKKKKNLKQKGQYTVCKAQPLLAHIRTLSYLASHLEIMFYEGEKMEESAREFTKSERPLSRPNNMN